MAEHRHDLLYNTSSIKGTGYPSTDNNADTPSYIKTEKAGEGKPHNNVQPSITVFVWRRVAWLYTLYFNGDNMYSPSQTISVKSGNTFSLFCSYFNDDGTELPLSDTTITADIKTKSKTLITALVVTKLDDNSFLLKLPVGVELPTGAYYTDIRLSTNGTVVNSDIIQINVKDVVTDV